MKGASKGKLWAHVGISEIKLMPCDAPDAFDNTELSQLSKQQTLGWAA